MRIVIDMQGAQTSGSRARGIGRYTMSIVQAIVRSGQAHEIILALSGLFPETIESIRLTFQGLLPQENIRVWHAPNRVAYSDSVNQWRRKSSELIREAFLASLGPDVIYVTSLFEGYVDDAVTSIGLLSAEFPTAVTLFDLIPYIYPDPYLENPGVAAWYHEKIASLRRADLCLAISDSSRLEGIDQLGLPEQWVVNVSTDADTYFRHISISSEQEAAVRSRHALTRPFIMYTGGIDHRKNIEGLIRAFSRLPARLRDDYQLAIVCSIQPESRQNFERLLENEGLRKSSVVFTGFVPEADLLALYNLCSLFVFPSWHEGFGLPALEAMRCGAPVIGANTSSLPEVIGWSEAMFDPYSDDEMAQAISRALSDKEYRTKLIQNAQRQSDKFSWEETAKQAIAAMEKLYAHRQQTLANEPINQLRPRLAYVSPLPPQRTGIADYSAELLPHLAQHYEIEVISAQEEIDDPWIKANCPIRSAQWFNEHADDYERVLYHFGNSEFHQHMFGMLKRAPGVVVLHDFYLSGVIAHMDVTGVAPAHWARELYFSHGYKALHDRFHCKDTGSVVIDYPCSLGVIQDSMGLIVHSSHSLKLASKFYGPEVAEWEVIPLARDSTVNIDRDEARRSLGLGHDDFLVCTFGLLGPTKLNHRLLEAWNQASLAGIKRCRLVFVGQNDPGVYGRELLAKISRQNANDSISITGWTDREAFRQYLSAADLCVQLRSCSRGETSAAVLDAMNHSIPVIVNANGSMDDLDASAVWKLPDEFTDKQLVEALETLWQHRERREQMGRAARKVILEQHDPQHCAELYKAALERFYVDRSVGLPGLLASMAELPGTPSEDADLIPLANSIVASFLPRNRPRQLLVDISELVQRDAKTGVQRVVRNILGELLGSSCDGFRIEPVYATRDQTYRYARRFTARLLNLPENLLHDEPIDYAAGDLFLGLDLQPEIVTLHRQYYQKMRHQGVIVKFVVYDLLCVSKPHFFLPGAADRFTSWLEVIAQSDGALCISQAVAMELRDWVDQSVPANSSSFDVCSFQLGADQACLGPSKELPFDAAATLSRLRLQPTFLIVATIEPRKGHAQVLEAFEQLWRSDLRLNLVFVGKQGWMVEPFINYLQQHPELGSRLFWLDSISDHYLEQVYTASTCLIAASYGEGFGLPLVEAAQYGLPIVARDIPVFREVAGEHAYYFSAESPSQLAESIQQWLQLYREGVHPPSRDMPVITWSQSTTQLMDRLSLSKS
jgi:glycosyltransferase involved in cell wall biosynthesis